ncbi:MAG: gephyrin-like molybdotransferase Glp [Pseudomonadota bacterium]
MLSVEEALARILALMSPTTPETAPLLAAAGRVLAEPALARRTQPPFPASAMDGYAVRGDDVRPGAVFRVIGEAQAGRRHDGPVGPGEAVRIFTGAPVPEGADRIVIQEDAERASDVVTLKANLDPQAYIRPAGTDFAVGETLSAPRRLTPQDVALLAAMNLPQVPVRRRPIVALIPTGDELVEPGETPGPDQIVSSNAYGLAGVLAAQGAEPRLMPIARDDPASLRAAFDAAQGADLIVTLGGASVGDHDLVRQVAGDQGLALDFYRVAMRPGKPLMAGRLGATPMVGLPGNPVSAIVCGHVFLRPAVDALLGLPAAALPRERARLARPLAANGPREHYARAALQLGPDGVLGVDVAERQDSSLLSVLSRANALAVIPPRHPAQPAGAEISVIRI